MPDILVLQALGGVKMELEDCGFDLLKVISPTIFRPLNLKITNDLPAIESTSRY